MILSMNITSLTDIPERWPIIASHVHNRSILTQQNSTKETGLKDIYLDVKCSSKAFKRRLIYFEYRFTLTLNN